MRGPISLFAWYAFLVGLAFVAVSTGLDRQSRRDHEFSASVPEPFRGLAQETIATDALIANDPDRALAEAKTLVRRRPIPAENLFLLAVAQAESGQSVASVSTMELASQRGWRVPQIQMVAIDGALRSNNPQVAAARLLALWSINADPEMLQQATKQVLAAPGGPQAFGATLATSHFMQDTVLRRSLGYTAPAPFVEMVEAARAAGAKFDCSSLRMLAATLTKQRHMAEAARLSGPHCPPRHEASDAK